MRSWDCSASYLPAWCRVELRARDVPWTRDAFDGMVDVEEGDIAVVGRVACAEEGGVVLVVAAGMVGLGIVDMVAVVGMVGMIAGTAAADRTGWDIAGHGCLVLDQDIVVVVVGTVVQQDSPLLLVEMDLCLM